METIQENKITKFTQGFAKTSLSFRENTLNIAENTLSTLDFPTTRNERWKYTRVAKIANKSFSSKQGTISHLNLPVADAHTIVFVNGFFNAALSSLNLQEGIEVSPLSATSTEVIGSIVGIENAVFPALNTLYLFV